MWTLTVRSRGRITLPKDLLQHLGVGSGDEIEFELLPDGQSALFAWAARFRRLARDYERLDTTLKGLHLLAFATLMLRNLADILK